MFAVVEYFLDMQFTAHQCQGLECVYATMNGIIDG